MFPSPRRFNRSIQSKEIRLRRNPCDHLDNASNLIGFHSDLIHRLGQLIHFLLSLCHSFHRVLGESLNILRRNRIIMYGIRHFLDLIYHSFNVYGLLLCTICHRLCGLSKRISAIPYLHKRSSHLIEGYIQTVDYTEHRSTNLSKIPNILLINCYVHISFFHLMQRVSNIVDVFFQLPHGTSGIGHHITKFVLHIIGKIIL